MEAMITAQKYLEEDGRVDAASPVHTGSPDHATAPAPGHSTLGTPYRPPRTAHLLRSFQTGATPLGAVQAGDYDAWATLPGDLGPAHLDVHRTLFRQRDLQAYSGLEGSGSGAQVPRPQRSRGPSSDVAGEEGGEGGGGPVRTALASVAGPPSARLPAATSLHSLPGTKHLLWSLRQDYSGPGSSGDVGGPPPTAPPAEARRPKGPSATPGASAGPGAGAGVGYDPRSSSGTGTPGGVGGGVDQRPAQYPARATGASGSAGAGGGGGGGGAGIGAGAGTTQRFAGASHSSSVPSGSGGAQQQQQQTQQQTQPGRGGPYQTPLQPPRGGDSGYRHAPPEPAGVEEPPTLLPPVHLADVPYVWLDAVGK